jgi:hypothetical protein
VQAIERGEKLEDMMRATDDLSASSKIFLQGAKKANSRCCVVM